MHQELSCGNFCLVLLRIQDLHKRIITIRGCCFTCHMCNCNFLPLSSDNYYSLVCLLSNVGTETLQQFLKSQWPAVLRDSTGQIHEDRSDLPDDHDHDHDQRLNEYERAKVESGKISKWDFTILIKVLMHSSLNFVKRGSEEFKMLDKLWKISTNLLKHVEKASLPTALFTGPYQQACDILKSFGASDQAIDDVQAGRFLNCGII